MTSNPSDALDRLVELLRGRRLALLTGAGISTESGIPDYRGEGTRARARNPIQHREFLARPELRARYWSRSMIGWPRFAATQPNAAHAAVAELERAGLAAGVITQNVDRLHQAAGSRRVIELHGALAVVRCLDCPAELQREVLQARLVADNPSFVAPTDALAPDGDADVERALDDFVVPSCEHCGGVLKPKVVFFGDSVPRPLVEEAYALQDAAEVLVVVGSSLAVFSGYRFVKRAIDRGQSVVFVNRGEARGIEHAALHVDALAGTALPYVTAQLVSGAPPRACPPSASAPAFRAS